MKTFPLSVVAAVLGCGLVRIVLEVWRAMGGVWWSPALLMGLGLVVGWLYIAARGTLEPLGVVGVSLLPLGVALLWGTGQATGGEPLAALVSAAALRTTSADGAAALLMAAAFGAAVLVVGSGGGRQRHLLAVVAVASAGALTLVLQGTAAHDEWRALSAATLGDLSEAERLRDDALGALLFDTKVIGVGMAVTLQVMVVVGLWVGVIPTERQPGRRSALAIVMILLAWSAISWGQRSVVALAQQRLGQEAAARPTLVVAESRPCEWPGVVASATAPGDAWAVPAELTGEQLHSLFKAHGAGVVTLVGARAGRPLDKVPSVIRGAFWARPQLASASVRLAASRCEDCLAVELQGDVVRVGDERKPLTWATLPPEPAVARARLPQGLSPAQVVHVASTLEAARIEAVWELVEEE